MAGKILLEVVTPEKMLLSQDVDMVIAPGSEGEFGVLPGHCHFLSTLRIGELRFQTGDVWHYMSVLWGYAEVTPAKVTVMAEVAEKAEDIDIGRAQQAVEAAEQRLHMLRLLEVAVRTPMGVVRQQHDAEVQLGLATQSCLRRHR